MSVVFHCTSVPFSLSCLPSHLPTDWARQGIRRDVCLARMCSTHHSRPLKTLKTLRSVFDRCSCSPVNTSGTQRFLQLTVGFRGNWFVVCVWFQFSLCSIGQAAWSRVVWNAMFPVTSHPMVTSWPPSLRVRRIGVVCGSHPTGVQICCTCRQPHCTLLEPVHAFRFR